MLAWLKPPEFEDRERTRQGRLLHRLLVAMAVCGLLSISVALLDPKNSLPITLSFYGATFGWLAVVTAIVRRGRVVLAAWVLSLFFWALIAFVTLGFGGLQGQNASTFAVCTLLIGGVAGGRAAIGMALASSLWCGFVMYLELAGRLPFNLGPYTPLNAWTSLTVTVLMTSVLLHESLSSLRAMHVEAQNASLARDEALRRSVQGQKMELVGSLTSGIAHDLNNLLTVIVGTTEILRAQTAPTDTPTRDLLDELDVATSRSALMTRQLLAFGRTKPSAGGPLDVGALVEGNSRMLARLLGSAIEVRARVDANLFVVASRSALEQILLNLAVNAREAMPDGGVLELTVHASGDRVVLSVRDGGVGMDAELQTRIFEPFFTTKPTGTGLGLATIRQLVTQHGGEIEVESAAGQGSTFRVSFPRVPAPDTHATPRPAEASSTTAIGGTRERGRIVLAEDDALVRTALSRLLTHAGYEVIAVQDGVEALALLEGAAELPLCVVTDVSMRRMDGTSLAEQLAEKRPCLPVILISGNQQPALATGSGSPREFLPKPVTRDELCAAIRRLTKPRSPKALVT
jgi:two-component system, cell cycle sensor histidine kinase and response regulator CckA